MNHAEHFDAIVSFLREIGLKVSIGALPEKTFLPGISLRAGALHVDPTRLRWPGDLLHEAGHLAVLPSTLRAVASDDLPDMGDALGGGELEALAWAYAAAVHLAIPSAVVFHAGGYKGQSEQLIFTYAMGVCPGLRGLCDAGLAYAPGFSAETMDANPYPQMLKWLRD